MEKIAHQNLNYQERDNKDYKRTEALIEYLQIKFPQYKFVGEVKKFNYTANNITHEYWISVDNEVSDKQKLEIVEQLRLTCARFVCYQKYTYNNY